MCVPLSKERGRVVVGSAPGEGGIRLTDPTVSSRHALLQFHEGAWFVADTQSTNGTRVGDVRVTDWVRLNIGDVVRFGAVEAVFAADVPSGVSHDPGPKRKRVAWASWLPSLGIHAVLLFVISQLVLFVARKDAADFTSEEGASFVMENAPSGPPPGGEAAAGANDPQTFQVQTNVVPELSADMIATTAAASFQITMPTMGARSSNVVNKAFGGSPTGGGGGTSYRSAGLGAGSGFGKGVGAWVGGGSGGIGISGRGKSLKTINEFSVYFVIHSGDWYAALDTVKAPDARQKEESPPGLADERNINWLNKTPVPNTGPFINYFWGIRDVRGGEDVRANLVEFTPGAMGNLLRFVRQASADAIKGAAKPSAVVLDKSLVPYDYNKETKQLAWLPEGREKLRETLRRGLPKFESIYGDAYGYIWNPKPEDRTHPDFTVEYLLDVRPMPPFVFFTGNDEFTLSEAEVDTLYQYILRGGAIWGDSGFAGNRSKFDAAFKREMKRVIPDVDKPFRALRKEGDLFVAGPDAYFDRANDFDRLPYGMQFYDAPIEVIEVMPGLVSVVLTKNAYGNFLRFETAVVNNRFQIGGDIGRGAWAKSMWRFREEFFRGLNDQAIVDSYKLGTNILVYMLGRWPAVLNRPENRGRFE